MGLLDSDDSAIKNSQAYKAASKAVAKIDVAMEDYKKSGGEERFMGPIAQAVNGAFLRIETGVSEHPDFKEWKDMRAKAIEVGGALVEKYPDAGILKGVVEQLAKHK